MVRVLFGFKNIIYNTSDEREDQRVRRAEVKDFFPDSELIAILQDGANNPINDLNQANSTLCKK